MVVVPYLQYQLGMFLFLAFNIIAGRLQAVLLGNDKRSLKLAIHSHRSV